MHHAGQVIAAFAVVIDCRVFSSRRARSGDIAAHTFSPRACHYLHTDRCARLDNNTFPAFRYRRFLSRADITFRIFAFALDNLISGSLRSRAIRFRVPLLALCVSDIFDEDVGRKTLPFLSIFSILGRRAYILASSFEGDYLLRRSRISAILPLCRTLLII